MNSAGPSEWNADAVLGVAREYQAAVVLTAAAELNLFSAISDKGDATADELASATHWDLRGLTILLNALAGLGLVRKQESRFALAPGIREVLTPEGDKSVLAMVQHQGNCLRRWAQLARTIKTGQPADAIQSVLGEAGDQQAFIGAMHNISAPIADEIIRAIQPLSFHHLLDIGGGSGTWTMAFLRAWPKGKATIFDLPHVIAMAEERLRTAGMLERVRLVPGNFYVDELPAGVDLAWVSAIVHQNSRQQNRELFAKVFCALQPGGRIAIRDIVMEPDRTRPVAGALFAVNMLVATAGGDTFTFDELKADLAQAGFEKTALVRQDAGMHSIVVAEKP